MSLDVVTLALAKKYTDKGIAEVEPRDFEANPIVTGEIAAGAVTTGKLNSVTQSATTSTASPLPGGTFTVPALTYNAKGQVTGKDTKTITLPNSPLKVEGLSPDTTASRNIKLTYTYETESAFETAKAGIPVGARVIKMWEFPDAASVSSGYSLSEVNTGVTWLNGKDIYKKTVNFGALPNATSKTVAHGITGLDIFVKPPEGIAIDASGGQYWPLPLVASTQTGNITLTINNSDIAINTLSGNRSAFVAYVTLYYTKN